MPPRTQCRSKRNYCSQTCIDNKFGRHHKVCPTCGKEFKVCKSFGFRKYCSSRCFGLLNIKRKVKKETDIERGLRAILEKIGCTFESQKPILGATLPDFFIEPNIALYADGEYWHSLPKTARRDKRINHKLKMFGYTVLRFPGNQIKTQPSVVEQTIRSATLQQA